MSATVSSPLLIVEDDLALQKQIKWSLDRFESVTASDRESALVQFRRHNPAVVTMDLGLRPTPIRCPKASSCWSNCWTPTRT